MITILKKILIGFLVIVGIISIYCFVQSSKYRIYGTAEATDERFVIDDNVRCTYSGAVVSDKPVICQMTDNGISFKNRGLGYGTYSYEFTIEGEGLFP